MYGLSLISFSPRDVHAKLLDPKLPLLLVLLDIEHGLVWRCWRGVVCLGIVMDDFPDSRFMMGKDLSLSTDILFGLKLDMTMH